MNELKEVDEINDANNSEKDCDDNQHRSNEDKDSEMCDG